MKKLDLENVRIYSNTKDDILDAMDLIDEEVYLSNFSDFNTYDMCNLAGVIGIKYIESDSCHFLAEGDKGLGLHKYRFLILAKDAKFKEEEKEKVLRPFKDINEFRTTIGCVIGNVITYKKKDSDVEYTVLFNGYVRINDGVLGIYLGRRCHTLEELKNDYIYLNVNEWKPFGVEEITKVNKPLDLSKVNKPLDLSNARIYSYTEEELTKVKNTIAALLESLSHYTGRHGVKAYWGSHEGYEKFINSVVESCNIIEKELAKF